MTTPQFNIKFRNRYTLKQKKEYYLSLFTEQLFDKSSGVIGRVLNNHVFIKFQFENRHFWSPEMELTFEDDEEGTTVRETIGPNSSIYTLTMFLFFFATTLLILTLMFLLSQITLEMDTTISWMVIIFASLFLLSNFLFLLYGRIKGLEQMKLLQKFSQELLKK